MKKVTVITLCVILIISTYYWFNKTEEIIPFEHPLFITKNDLKTIDLSNFKYINNHSTLNFYRTMYPDDHGDDIFDATIYLYPSREKRIPSSIEIYIYQRNTEKKTKKQFNEFENSYSNDTTTEVTKNYKNIGQENILVTKKNNGATLIFRDENFVVRIEVYVDDSVEEATEKAEKLGEYYLSKIEK